MALMPVWSTRRQGDPSSLAHRMKPDAHGRPTTSACGRSTDGLWFRRDVEWERVPETQRCPECGAEPFPAGNKHEGLVRRNHPRVELSVS
jgi:hypothetical protein